MKTRILVFFISCLFIFMIGCNKEKYNYEKSSFDKINTLSGVSIKTTESSYKGNIDFINVTLSNFTNEKFMYGEGYNLEYYYKNSWVIIPLKNNWSDVGYTIDKNSTKEIEYNIKNHITVDSLSPGRYRIVINIYSRSETTPKEFYNIASEFNIENK